MPSGPSQTQVKPGFVALAIAFFVFVLLGAVDSSLGVAWPSMSDTLDRGISDLGILIFSGGAGYLVASSTFGFLQGKFGTGSLLVLGATLALLGLVGVATSQEWWMLVTSPLFIGFGGGLVDTGLNAHAALAFDTRAMNLLHACFGVGATLGPLVITASLTATGEWRAGYVTLALAQVVGVGALWFMRRRWVAGVPFDSDAPPIRRRRRSALFIAIFFLYTGVEFGTGYWAFTLLTEGRGVATAVAGGWVAAYWAGLTVGRFGAGIVGNRFTPRSILTGGVLVALMGLAILWWNPGDLGVVGLPIIGLGLAPIFPTLVSVTPRRLGSDRSAHAIGYQMAAATVGGTVLPWLTGVVAGVRGLNALAWCLFALGLLLTVVILVNEHEATADF